MSTNSYAPRSGTRLVNLSLANLLLAMAVMMPLLGVSAARADDTFTVRTINRSISKIDVTVTDRNNNGAVLLKGTLEAGAERSFQAVRKAPQGGGPATTHITWTVTALNSQGFPFKPGEKPAVNSGCYKTSTDNEKFALGPFNASDVNKGKGAY